MFDFDSIMDDYLIKQPYERKVGRYYASEAGSCLRQCWYSFKKPLPPTPEQARLFEMGKMIHQLADDALTHSKNLKLLKSEQKCRIECGDFVINGRADALVSPAGSDKCIVVEVKSTASLEEIEKLGKPMEHHASQLQLYLHALGQKEGVVLYIEKPNLKSKCFAVEHDEAIVKKLLERFALLDKLLKEEKLPPAEARESSDEKKKEQCEGCVWKTECEKN